MKSIQLLPLLAVLLASPAVAQTPVIPGTEPEAPVYKVVLTPAQTDKILKELDKVETLIGKGRGSVFTAAMAKFREGMASPTAALALYLDCYRLEHFERKNLKQVDFMDWKKKNEDRLKDDDFKRALWLQLEFLVLTIQAQEIDEPKKMAPIVASLQAFLGKAVTAIQGSTSHSASGALTAGRKGGNVPVGDILGTLRQSVADSDFAKAYSLQDFLKREEWEYQPLNVRGIYKDVIFPYYLAEKPTELPAQWDARIYAERTMRQALMSDAEFNEFIKDEGPRLLWQKDNYLVVNNVNAVAALADMLKVIQTYPSHPDAISWLKDFRSIVKQVSEPVPVSAEKPAGVQ